MRALYPLYQPVYDIERNIVLYYEALARFDDTGDEVSPAAMVCLAERLGIIDQIDLAMLAMVFEAMLRHHDKRLAVNISMVTLENASDKVFALLSAYHLLAPRLTFEITETAYSADIAKTLSSVKAFRSFGSMFSIDDFGDGHMTTEIASILQPDFIKISGNVVGKAFAENDFSEIHTALEVARRCGSRVIAEHVDAVDKLLRLRAMGISLMQGYLLCKPSELHRCTVDMSWRREKPALYVLPTAQLFS